MKKAFITGITGQDGAWLAKCLLDQGYDVLGGMRRTSTLNLWRHEFLGLGDRLKLVNFNLSDYSNIFEVISEYKPDEVYNLAAQSFVGVSFKQPISTCQVTGMGVGYLLDVIKTVSPQTKFYQASSSEMFGLAQQSPQTESTPFYPRSPYGCAKLFGHWMTVNYRESYNMFCCSGLLFNHESELRGTEFVTRKITSFVAGNWLGKKEILELGNLDAYRDWGHAEDYCRAMYLMMQHTQADTFVIATGVTHSVRDFVQRAFAEIGKTVVWEGNGANETGRDKQTGDLLVKIHPSHYRPAEVERLCGDATKARTLLGWQPSINLEQLVQRMVRFDISLEEKRKR